VVVVAHVVVDVDVEVVDVDVVVVGAMVVVVVPHGAVVVVVPHGAVVVVVLPAHTWVRLNVEPTCPPLICAVAVNSVSVKGTLTAANLSFAVTVPATTPAVWKVAEMLTKPLP
jgi:hypothetical protein